MTCFASQILQIFFSRRSNTRYGADDTWKNSFFLLLNMLLFNNNYCIRQDIYRRYSVIWTSLSFFLCTNTCIYESIELELINDKVFKNTHRLQAPAWWCSFVFEDLQYFLHLVLVPERSWMTRMMLEVPWGQIT